MTFGPYILALAAVAVSGQSEALLPCDRSTPHQIVGSKEGALIYRTSCSKGRIGDELVRVVTVQMDSRIPEGLPETLLFARGRQRDGTYPCAFPEGELRTTQSHCAWGPGELERPRCTGDLERFQEYAEDFLCHVVSD